MRAGEIAARGRKGFLGGAAFACGVLAPGAAWAQPFPLPRAEVVANRVTVEADFAYARLGFADVLRKVTVDDTGEPVDGEAADATVVALGGQVQGMVGITPWLGLCTQIAYHSGEGPDNLGVSQWGAGLQIVFEWVSGKRTGWATVSPFLGAGYRSLVANTEITVVDLSGAPLGTEEFEDEETAPFLSGGIQCEIRLGAVALQPFLAAEHVFWRELLEDETAYNAGGSVRWETGSLALQAGAFFRWGAGGGPSSWVAFVGFQLALGGADRKAAG